jgi:protein phosphatase
VTAALGAPNATSWVFDPSVAVLRIASASDRGHVRRVNEDRVLARAGVFGVADGMGGPGGGDIAAEAAVTAFEVSLAAGATIEQALAAAHNAVLASSRRAGGVTGMGTTLTAGAIGWVGRDPVAVIAHAGDSRVYLSRRGREARALTRDQRWVQDLVDEGVIDQESARTHPRRNEITSALGVEPLAPQFATLPLRSGDRLLFCTDGVHGEVPDRVMSEVLTSAGSPSMIVDEVMGAALDGRGPDNASVVCVEVLTHRAHPHRHQPRVTRATA